VVTPAQRATLAAAMDRILPGARGAGATAADAVSYTDWLFANDAFASAEAKVAAGVSLLDSLARGMWETDFAACGPGERDAVLARLTEVPHRTAQRFFTDLVLLSLTGFLCAPRYGGNAGGIGWKSIGFAPHPNTEGAP
jgi:hypothetical protein